jgi:predicted permease
VRLLARSPLFTIFAAASLALGIGATSAIFSLFDGLVLRKLPVPEPDRLVVLSFGPAGGNFNYSLPYPHFDQIRARNTTLAGVFAINPFGRVTVGHRGQAETADGTYVTGDYYRTLGLAPRIGRLLARDDDRPGQNVAVLSHAYWQRRFGGRLDVVGATVGLNTIPFTIVGVEPAGFFGTEVGRPYDIAVPMRAIEVLSEGRSLWNEAFATWIYIMGRLKPGVSLVEAERELKVIFAQVGTEAARDPNQVRLAREHQLRLEGGAKGSSSDLRVRYERWLTLLLVVLGAVLLLASLNVATLLLSRSDARQREIATRQALGAGRWRIVRQFLTESMVLACLAGALGVVIASWGSRTLLRIATPTSERLLLDLTPSVRLVAFTGIIAAATCLLFGVIPAIRATSPGRLLAGRQLGGGRQRRVLDRTLVASQVAISLVLLVTAGLFVRTLGKLWAQETGYDRHQVLMFSVDARLAGKKGPDVPMTYRRLIDELHAVPGARSVTASAVRPVSTNLYLVDSVSQVGEKTLSREQRIRVAFNVVAPGYFGTLGIPLMAGRDFDERDSGLAPKVVIISERMARHFTGNPVGQRIGRGPGARKVIGVAKDMRYAKIKDAPREVLYYPFFQSEPRDLFFAPTFEVRYAGAPSDVLESIRRAVSRVDSGLEMFGVRTLEAQTQDSLSRERLLALLTTYFGGFAVLLACIGLYGLMSYAVTQRTAEIGVRMALGAQPAAVSWLIVREAAVTVAVGAVAGLSGAFSVVGLVKSQLFGIEPHDPLALGGATALLLAMAFVAAYLPARHASRIDPLTALRHE